MKFVEELKDVYTTNVWSELGDDMIEKLTDAVKDGLRAIHEEIPGDKVILQRLKGFYSSRRNVKLTMMDPEKSRKRKMEKKANHRTFVSVLLLCIHIDVIELLQMVRNKALQLAVSEGALDPDDAAAVSKKRKK